MKTKTTTTTMRIYLDSCKTLLLYLFKPVQTYIAGNFGENWKLALCALFLLVLFFTLLLALCCRVLLVFALFTFLLLCKLGQNPIFFLVGLMFKLCWWISVCTEFLFTVELVVWLSFSFQFDVAFSFSLFLSTSIYISQMEKIHDYSMWLSSWPLNWYT